MGTMRRGIGIMLVGWLGWAQTASANAASTASLAIPWVIESADYTGDVKDQIARLDAVYTLRVIADQWVEIPLGLQGVTVTAITIEKKAGEAHIIPRNDGYVLATARKGGYTVRVQFSYLLVQDSQFEGLQFGIPQAPFSTLSLVVPRKDIELRPSDQLYTDTQPYAPQHGVRLIARLGASGRVDLRWRTKPAAPVHVEPVLYGEVSTHVTMEEQLARLICLIDYRIAQGEVKQVQVAVPSGMHVLNVRGAGIEDWRVSEGTGHQTLLVMLGFTMKDTTYRLVVEGEEAITEGAAEYQLPEIRLLDVAQERGYVSLSREGSLEMSPGPLDGIHRVDVKDLPETLRTLPGSPAILAFKYHQHPYRLAVGLTRHQDHAVLSAIAEQGELVTVLSRQGELLTRATYLIKANKKQFLEAALPDGATLWSCIVAGQSVKPVEGSGRKLLIPLDAAADHTSAVSVELVYFERRPALVRIGRLALQGPVLDVPTTVSGWALYAPSNVTFLRFSGNLERGAAGFDFLEEPFVQVASAEPLREPSSMGRGFDAANSRKEKTSDLLNINIQDADLLRTRRAGLNVPKKVTDGRALQATASPEGSLAGVEELEGRLQEAGILPLKIRLPKSGTVHRFNRLMTSQEPLELKAIFVHAPMPWTAFAGFGLLLLPIGGLALVNVRRGS